MSSIHYFFTNHRNLLQAATKGYLSPLKEWTRFHPDFEAVFLDCHLDTLIFGSKPLPYAYRSTISKTHHSVAIGVSEETLVELGYVPSEFGFVGRNPIFIDRVAEIVFQSRDSIQYLKVRTPTYFELLDPTILSANEALFKQDEIQETPVDLNVSALPEDVTAEKKLSRAIGSLGHMLSVCASNSNPGLALQIDLICRHVYLENWQIDWPTLEAVFRKLTTEDTALTMDQSALLLLLFVHANLGIFGKEDLKAFKDLDVQVGTVNLNSYTCILSLFAALDNAAEFFGIELSRTDRNTFIKEVRNQFKATTKAEKELATLIDSIIAIYEYRSSNEELEAQIQIIDDPVRKLFCKGFEYFARDPLDFANIYRLIQNRSIEITDSVLYVALYLWGRVHGALSLQPLNLQSMFQVFGKENFYAIAMNAKERDFLLKSSKPDQSIHGQSVSYLDSKYFLHEGPRREIKDYEAYDLIISGTNGFKVELQREDHFEDVSELLQSLDKDAKSIDPELLQLMLEEIIPIALIYRQEGEESIPTAITITTKGRKPKLTFEYEVNGEALTGDLIFPSQKAFTESVVKQLGKHKLTLAEKRTIRDYMKTLAKKRTIGDYMKSVRFVLMELSRQLWFRFIGSRRD